MKSFLKTRGQALRISATAFFALAAVEAAGFSLLRLHSAPFEFVHALALGLGAAAVLALTTGFLLRPLRISEELSAAWASLLSGLLILLIALSLWLFNNEFLAGPRWAKLLSAACLLLLAAGAGFRLWRAMAGMETGDKSVSATGLDKSVSSAEQGKGVSATELVRARAGAFLAVAVLAAGVYSGMVLKLAVPAYRSAAVLLVAVLAWPLYHALSWVLKRTGPRMTAALGLALVILVSGFGVRGAWREHDRLSRPALADDSFPPVILITIDTLRADLPAPPPVPFSGGAEASLPPHLRPPAPSGSAERLLAIEELARDGVKFTHAVAPSNWTPTSVASILTGLNPRACGAGFLIPGEPEDYTGPLSAAPSLAQAFRDQGYVTAGFVHNAWLTRQRGFARGFQEYEFLEDDALGPRFLFTRLWSLVSARWRSVPDEPCVRLTDRALSWLAKRPEGPFFLWLHYIDPHLPYIPHAKYPARTRPGPMTELLVMDPVAMRIRLGYFGLTDQDRAFIRERYDGEVLATDDQVGRLIAGLKELGLYDRALIALTSDHGEEFWEHGDFEHGHSFHVEVIEVPLVIKLPGGEHAGAVAEQWVSLTRLGATLLERAGVKADFPGKSLHACLADERCGDSTIIGRMWISEMTLTGTDLGAIGDLTGNKAIFHGDGTITCYDLARDPKELSPRSEENCAWPAGLPGPRELWKQIRTRDQEIRQELTKRSGPRKPAGKDELQRLRDMGYIR